MTQLKPSSSIANIGAFFADGREKVFSDQEVMIDLGERPQGAYWIIAGHVKAASISNAGEERIHHIFKIDELFPAGWIFTGVPIIAAYIAMGDVVVRIKPIEEFEHYVESHPQVLDQVVQQLLAFYSSVYNLNLEPARQRVVYRLLVLCERFGADSESKDGFRRIDLSQTQQEFASSVRLSRETAGKILCQLEDEDVILMGRKTMRVRPETLRAILLE